MNYVLYKTEVWQRATFSEETDMEMIKELIKAGQFEDIFDTSIGYESNHVLHDTEEYLDSEDGSPTLEIYEYNREIYNNDPKRSI